MVVCKYYQSGRCKFGDQCRYEHIDAPRSGGAGGGMGEIETGQGSRGPLAGRLGTPARDPFSSHPNGGRGNDSRIRNNDNNDSRSRQGDTEQPLWPLSAVGFENEPTKGNALSGEMSPEEMRCRAYMAAPRGMSPEVIQAEMQMAAVHKAKVNCVSNGGKQMPPTSGDPFSSGAPPQQNSIFGSAAQAQVPNAGAFGQYQPQMVGAQPPTVAPSPFGAAAPVAGGASPFGAPTGSGSVPFTGSANAFGQPQHPAQIAEAGNAVPLSAAAEQQFSASQFGFAQVPETAPPPRFY